MGKTLETVVLTVTACAAIDPLMASGPIAKVADQAVPGEALVVLRREVADALRGEASVPDRLLADPEVARRLIGDLASITVRELVWLTADPAGDARQLDAAAGRLTRSALVRVEPSIDAATLVAALAAHPDVEHAEPNYLLRLQAVPNDPLFGSVLDPAPPGQWGFGAVDAPEAWDLESGNPSTVIAVIDSGIDLDHPDLAAKLWLNADEAAGDQNGDTCPGVCLTDDDGDGLIDEDAVGCQKSGTNGSGMAMRLEPGVGGGR